VLVSHIQGTVLIHRGHDATLDNFSTCIMH
jgi:hypothetical protein